MIILVDTREQRPYKFEQTGMRVGTVVTTLDTGDYSLDGCYNLCCVERKSKSDMYNTYSKGSKRFTDELARMQAMTYRAVIIECTPSEFRKGPDYYKSTKLPQWKYGNRVFATAIGWMARKGIPFIFAEDRKHGEIITYTLLKVWREELKHQGVL
jgi:ERCC4-type nuclease